MKTTEDTESTEFINRMNRIFYKIYKSILSTLPIILSLLSDFFSVLFVFSVVNYSASTNLAIVCFCIFDVPS